MKTIKTIKTHIKFYQGLDGVEDRLYGFVTKVNGSWRGCRENELRKKLVFVDPSIAKDIIPNQLYRCTLIPTRADGAFLAKHAKMMKFPAKISSIKGKGVWAVHVKFGNKTLIYEPASKDRLKNSIQTIAENIKSRKDLENPWIVAEDFINAACLIKRLYDQRPKECSAEE